MITYNSKKCQEEIIMKWSTKKICIIAVFMAMTVALSSFGIPVLGGKIYLNDVVICFAALILDPLSAFIVGGIGAFWGDVIFYPMPMFVSLVTHGLQAVAISFIARPKNGELPKFWLAVIAVAVGAVINVLGYTLGKIFVYSTFEYAMIKLPFQILQAVVGAAVGISLRYATPLRKINV